MGRLSYLAIVAFVLAGSLWLEVVLRTRVLRRWRRLLLSLVPVLVLFVAWDAYAIAAGHWTFDPERVTGSVTVGQVPVDEVAFFVVIPIAAILTLEAVRSVKPDWDAGEGGSPR